ncbi:lysylphosphatidylglycerol synthase domain-containing protein [Rhizobium sp. SSA_523]|uniref:lysylphosphatidylglycerol synthase domain-containing protein n=1 Tax=Rhizobium sp. SSA_523 TaxID=2952477 RepID=UPI002091DE2E|nr:lysylphosphatidylglycerol synthase domain-containing protein [Rhizobium sp. SSA_523]MCO5731408.1 lysylphosphatidylglycerol synthase domain-containing protein [Rhizobium sp. SSA_523]WKC22067.1 lysylphosphatidylglycerol synthase domain-containing protein [Rhizobium sp. SSA_523]
MPPGDGTGDGIILKKYGWSALGLVVVAISAWFLYKELRDLSLGELQYSLKAIPLSAWCLAVLASLAAYAALAGYDALALYYLRRRIAWYFITLTSFTTYALSHNLGASVLSGSVIRYRAYSSKGMSAIEIGQLVAFCSFTFALGTLLLSAITLLIEPALGLRLGLSEDAARGAGLVILLLIAAYVFGSWRQLRPFSIGPLKITYPNLKTVGLQLLIGPLELLAAAAIIYVVLPSAGNPGFVTILGIFLLSFSAALLSTAPGGLGVLELVFVNGLPEMDKSDVLAALIVFRLFYLLLPFALSLIVVLVFERRSLRHQL